MSNTYGCTFVFYGHDDDEGGDDPGILEDRILRALAAEGIDMDPMTLTIEQTNTADPDDESANADSPTTEGDV